MPKFSALRLVFLSMLLGSLVGCAYVPGIYQIPVEQGNQIDSAQVEQLSVGQTQDQVRFLLGTPAFINRLENDRWIYFHRVTVGETTQTNRKVIIDFTDGQVSNITDSE